MIERTLVLLKPDAVSRGLVGKIISVFEEVGLAVAEMKLMVPSDELVAKHYPENRKYLESLGAKSSAAYAAQGLDIEKQMGSSDFLEIGKVIKSWLVKYLSSGKVVAMVLEGNHAVANVRKLIGKTFPLDSDPGTIRGRFSLDSSDLANSEARPIKNLVHASGSVEEANFEIDLWFGAGAHNVG